MNLGVFGAALVLGISAIGSAIGIGIAGQASIGAWKKCYLNNKAAPFILTVFAGAPLTQTIYGFLLMQQMNSSSADPTFLFSLGIASSLAIAFSASCRGRPAPSARTLCPKPARAFRSISPWSAFAKPLHCSCWFSAWWHWGNPVLPSGSAKTAKLAQLCGFCFRW